MSLISDAYPQIVSVDFIKSAVIQFCLRFLDALHNSINLFMYIFGFENFLKGRQVN